LFSSAAQMQNSLPYFATAVRVFLLNVFIFFYLVFVFWFVGGLPSMDSTIGNLLGFAIIIFKNIFVIL
jgi:hypothetical protein